MKKLTSVLLALALALSLAACGGAASGTTASSAASGEAVSEAASSEEAKELSTNDALRIAGLKGPTPMGLVKLLSMKRTLPRPWTTICSSTVLPMRSCPC